MLNRCRGLGCIFMWRQPPLRQAKRKRGLNCNRLCTNPEDWRSFHASRHLILGARIVSFLKRLRRQNLKKDRGYNLSNQKSPSGQGGIYARASGLAGGMIIRQFLRGGPFAAELRTLPRFIKS